MPSPRTEWILPSGEYRVTTDRARVDLDVVHSFLKNESYWAQHRSREQNARAVELSTCFSVIHESTGAMVGFARVLTDDVSFGWVADVFVLADHRGRGLAGVLIARLVAEIHGRDDVPFLHATTTNTVAISRYRSLGFEARRTVDALGLTPPA
jgi:predicted GNAT family acetyltransferase